MSRAIPIVAAESAGFGLRVRYHRRDQRKLLNAARLGSLREGALRTLTIAIAGFVVGAPAGMLLPADAADAFYLGAWSISAAVPAPWADAGLPPGKEERAHLLGKTVTFKAKEIAGPAPFACKGLHYEISDFTPDLLFQGAFEEMQTKDKSVDPNKLAASLGFTSNHIKTLETGCEIDFHFVDASTAEVGLNNYVYTLKKR
jgi:hypothetical protein